MTSLDAKAETVLALFRAGSDTLEIAKAMNIPEPKVVSLMGAARWQEIYRRAEADDQMKIA